MPYTIVRSTTWRLDQATVKTPLVIVVCRVFGLYHLSPAGEDLHIGGLEGGNGGD